MKACEHAPGHGNMYPAGLTASSSAFHGLLSGADWLRCRLSGSACLNQGLERLRAVGKNWEGGGQGHVDGLRTNLGKEETQTLKTGCCCCPKKPDQREGKERNCIHCNTGERFSAC